MTETEDKPNGKNKEMGHTPVKNGLWLVCSSCGMTKRKRGWWKICEGPRKDSERYFG